MKPRDISREPSRLVQIEPPEVFSAPQSGREPLKQLSDPSAGSQRDQQTLQALDMIEETRLRIQLTWENVFVWPKPSGCCNSRIRTGNYPEFILDGVSGTVRPGQFLAIIGATGAGKTTLLQLLSGKMFPHNLASKGEVRINGKARDSINYAKFTGFVQQDDVLMENLSVRESLQFAADVKSPGTYSERTQRVAELLQELELEGCADYRFGNSQVRKGEKKRASMAVELVTNPSLLFVDEPTTGMDAHTAQKLVDVMGRLAAQGRTIVATIHQPSSEIYQSFDQLMILALGQTLYFNDASKARDIFDDLGFACPPRKNPAEHFMKILSVENFMDDADGASASTLAYGRHQKAIADLHEKYESSNNPLKCCIAEDPKAITSLTEEELEKRKYVAPAMVQFLCLLRRAWTISMRSPEAMVVRLAVTMSVMLLGYGLYYNMETRGYEGMQNRMGAQFYLVGFAFLESIQNILLVFPEERAVFLREQASSLYRISAYFLAKVLAELPFNTLVPLVAVLLAYWPWGLNSVYEYNFWVVLLGTELVYVAASGYGLILCSLIADRNALLSVQALNSTTSFLLSGFFVKVTTSATILYPLQYLDTIKYGLNILMRNEFEDSNFRLVSMTPRGPVILTGNDVLKSYDANPFEWWQNWVPLVIIIFATHLAAFAILSIYGKRV